MTNYTELRKLAGAAYPGPWEAEVAAGRGSWIKAANGFWCALSCGEHDDEGEANAAYIAAVSPDVLLALLDRLEAPADRVEKLEAALRFYADTNSWRTSTVYACGHSEEPKACRDGGDIARAALLTERAQL